MASWNLARFSDLEAKDALENDEVVVVERDTVYP